MSLPRVCASPAPAVLPPPTDSPAFGAAVRSLWRFGENVAYLNHGAFGATPVPVLAALHRWQQRIEEAPGPFMVGDLPGLLRKTASAVAAAFGVSGPQLVLTDNATTAINAVLNSFPFRNDDRILLTCHTYGAIRHAVRHRAAGTGLGVDEAVPPFPLPDAAALEAAVLAACTPRTRLAILDHIVSETGQVWPLAPVIAALKARGCVVLVDGAHAPGHIPLHVPALGADLYVGNLHKWLFTPRSCAFLWAAPDLPFPLHPTVISWGLNQGLAAEFDWVGTRDPSPWLCATEGLAFLNHFGFENISGYNRALSQQAVDHLTRLWAVSGPVFPPALHSVLRLVPLPKSIPADEAGSRALQTRLWQEHRLHVALIRLHGRLWVRLSTQIYNTLDDYDRLGQAILRIQTE